MGGHLKKARGDEVRWELHGRKGTVYDLDEEREKSTPSQ